MYNFGLLENEKLVYVFDDILVRINEEKFITTVALTTKRLLFLDYMNDNDDLRIAKYQTSLKYKEVYHQINLSDILKIDNNKIIIKDKSIIEFNNKDLIKLLMGEVVL